MEKFELNYFDDRIGLNTNTDLKFISEIICEKYSLGTFISNKLIEIGYEDYNYYLTTNKRKSVVKIFNNARSPEELGAYIERINIVQNSGVNTPKALKIDNRICTKIEYNNVKYNLAVFEYIDGENFFELGILPTENEIKELAKLTAIINNIDFKPEFIYDTWAIINFEKEYKIKREYLSLEYQEKFDDLLNRYKKIDLEKLPKGFVHGDIISTNVMKDKNNKLWIIDFAVSNYLPRIIDLAVLSCNMCLDIKSKEQTAKNITLLIKEYNKYNELTDYEIECFSLFYELANAMHIICTTYIAKTEEDSSENRYWLEQGMIGLSYLEEVEKSVKNLKV